MKSMIEFDVARTELLNIPELAVIKGKGNPCHFYTTAKKGKVYKCPACGGESIKNQGIKHREYTDICVINDDASVILVDYQFNKYKCLQSECGRVFAKPISFASPFSRTTHRLEDAIVRMIVREAYSYAEAAETLGGRFCRQVVGQIYLRRKKELEEDTSSETEWYRIISSDLMTPMGRLLAK